MNYTDTVDYLVARRTEAAELKFKLQQVLDTNPGQPTDLTLEGGEVWLLVEGLKTYLDGIHGKLYQQAE
jgi:hypothetical protein